MNIPKELQEYLLSWGIDDEKRVNRLLSKPPVEDILNKQLHYLDCTRIGKFSGMRLQQTIGYPYAHDITITLHIISKLDEDDQNYWLNKVITRHKDNLEYEKLNPPIWYDKKHWKNPNKTKKSIIRKTKQVKDKPIKTSYAQAPLKINPKFRIKL